MDNILSLLVLVVAGIGIGFMLDAKNKGGTDAKEIIASLMDIDEKNDSMSASELADSANKLLRDIRK